MRGPDFKTDEMATLYTMTLMNNVIGIVDECLTQTTIRHLDVIGMETLGLLRWNIVKKWIGYTVYRFYCALDCSLKKEMAKQDVLLCLKFAHNKH